MVSIITIYTNVSLIMTASSFAFFRMIKKEHKRLIFAFPLKIEAFSLFCLLNLSF